MGLGTTCSFLPALLLPKAFKGDCSGGRPGQGKERRLDEVLVWGGKERGKFKVMGRFW